MNTSENWIKDELLQAFYAVVDDFRAGTINEEMFKDRLLRLAKRYERVIGKKELNVNQKYLF